MSDEPLAAASGYAVYQRGPRLLVVSTGSSWTITAAFVLGLLTFIVGANTLIQLGLAISRGAAPHLVAGGVLALLTGCGCTASGASPLARSLRASGQVLSRASPLGRRCFGQSPLDGTQAVGCNSLSTTAFAKHWQLGRAPAHELPAVLRHRPCTSISER